MRPTLLRIVLILVVLTASPVRAGQEVATRVDDATAVLGEVMGIPEKGIPASLLDDAHAVAVVPGVIKVGFVLGGRRGRGVMVVRNKGKKWSRPVFITLTGGSIGWQVGAQSTDVILVFRSARSVDGVLSGKFTLGGDASVAAGPVGRRAEASTDIKLKAEIYAYSRSRGLFAGVSFQGARLNIDEDANASFYGTRALSARGILKSEALVTPPAARRFLEQLRAISHPAVD